MCILESDDLAWNRGSACHLQTIMKTGSHLKVLICKMGTTVMESQWKWG